MRTQSHVHDVSHTRVLVLQLEPIYLVKNMEIALA